MDGVVADGFIPAGKSSPHNRCPGNQGKVDALVGIRPAVKSMPAIWNKAVSMLHFILTGPLILVVPFLLFRFWPSTSSMGPKPPTSNPQPTRSTGPGGGTKGSGPVAVKCGKCGIRQGVHRGLARFACVNCGVTNRLM